MSVCCRSDWSTDPQAAAHERDGETALRCQRGPVEAGDDIDQIAGVARCPFQQVTRDIVRHAECAACGEGAQQGVDVPLPGRKGAFGLVADADRCADAVAGSLAVFSQLGLHVAHLVVMLYNIYKSDRLGEIILAGGVTHTYQLTGSGAGARLQRDGVDFVRIPGSQTAVSLMIAYHDRETKPSGGAVKRIEEEGWVSKSRAPFGWSEPVVTTSAPNPATAA